MWESMIAALVQHDFGAYSSMSKYFKEKTVRLIGIDEVDSLDSLFYCMSGTINLGNHTRTDDSTILESINLIKGQGG